jgi:predicted nucleotide-binding protein
MKKEKSYYLAKFSSDKIQHVYQKWLNLTDERSEPLNTQSTVSLNDETWSYDNNAEFFADFQKNYERAFFVKTRIDASGRTSHQFYLSASREGTTIQIQAPSRPEIEEIFNIIDADWQKFKLPETKQVKLKPSIFIGHGRSGQWRELKDHLTDKHDYQIIAYETGARAGHTIRDILDEMMAKSSFAILVMTAEDELADGKKQARPNVIHETGLFQGKLGFSRAIVLLEEGAEEFSNLFGVQQIRYNRNNIKETFGDVLATLKREFSV